MVKSGEILRGVFLTDHVRGQGARDINWFPDRGSHSPTPVSMSTRMRFSGSNLFLGMSPSGVIPSARRRCGDAHPCRLRKPGSARTKTPSRSESGWGIEQGCLGVQTFRSIPFSTEEASLRFVGPIMQPFKKCLESNILKCYNVSNYSIM